LDTAEIDLRRYIEIMWKWRLVIGLLTIAAVAASGIFSFFVLSPVYETKVTLFVTDAASSQQSIRSSGDSSVAETVSRIPAMTLNTYMNQVTSQYLMDRVVNVIGVADLSASSLDNMVSAQVLKDTSLIEVRVQNTDKALAVNIANTIASEFVQFVSEMNQDRMAKSLAFLAEQEAVLKVDLQTAYDERARIQAKPDNAAALTREISTKNQVVVNLRAQLAELQADVTLLTAALRQVDQQLASTPATITGEGGVAIPNPAYQALVSAQAQKTTELSTASARASAAAQEISSLERSVATLEGKLVLAQNEEAVAEADVTRMESTLNLLSSKIVEAQMAHSLNLGETTISVVSPAMEPKNPVKPRKLVNMAVAGVLGGFVSLLLVFVLEYMDNTIKTQDDVQKYLNTGTLGTIPLIETRKRRKK